MANINKNEITYEGIKSRGIANDLWAPFERANAAPMDITEVFGSLANAINYAKNNATSYAGQVIAVAGENIETKVYKITSGGTLTELADETLVKKVSIDVLTETLVKENALEAYDTLEEVSAWIKSHPEDAAKMNLDITALKESAHTHSNKNILDDISQANINAWTNPSKAVSANTAVSATCLYNKNYPGYGIDVKYIAKGDDFGGSDSYYTYISVNGESNFNNMAHFNDGIHLCNGGAYRGGVIYFGDNVDKDEVDEGKEIYPYTYIGERLDDTIEIKSSKIAIGNIGNDILTNEDGETVYDENEQPIHTGEYKVDGIFIGLDIEDNFDDGESVSSLTLNKGLRIVTNDNEGSYGATLNIPLNVEDSVNANSVYAENVPNSIKFNDKTYNVVSGTVNLGNIISQSVSADTSIISDSAITSESSKCIFDEEYPNNGVSIKSITKGDDGESKTYVNVDGESNFNGMACFNENIHLCNHGDSEGGFLYFGDNLHEDDYRHWTYIGERSDDTLEIHSTRVGVGRFNTEDNSIDGVFIGDDSSKMRFNTGLFLRGSEDENSIIDATFKVPLYVTSDIHEKGVKLEEKYSSIDHIHEEFVSLSGISNTVAEIESTVEDLDSKVYAHGNRLDAIENDCLVLNESKYLQLMNSVFNLGLSECLTNFTTTVYLGKKSDGTYFRPSDYTSNPALITEAHFATWNTGTIGHKGFCNTITVKPYDFTKVLNTTYLLVKVMSASCTLPSTGVTGGVKKDFGILKSKRTVDGIANVQYYNFAIYSGDTLAIPLTSNYIIPDDFLSNNVIGDEWSSGLFDITSIVYNPSTSFTSRVNMTPFTGTPQGTYTQTIVGIMDDTNLPNNKNIIIDNILSKHDLRLPSSPRIGKKYEIIHTHKSATLKSGNVNIIRDEGYTNAQSLSASTVSSVIYNGVSWYFYTNLLSNIY